jgi:hypothetical protein
LEGSTNTGGAKTIAVDDTTAGVATDVRAAPTGSRTAAGFAFWAAVRRTGANARAADHPSEDTNIGFNKRILGPHTRNR